MEETQRLHPPLCATESPAPNLSPNLCQHFVHDSRGLNAREPMIESLVLEGEPIVVDAEQVH